MNTYLLDTHILLWWLSNDKHLPSKARDCIADADTIIFISVVNVWEMIIKKSLNKLIIPDNLQSLFEDSDFKILPITLEHVLQLEQLPPLHNDPFDRLLIAQCVAENAILITEDQVIKQYPIHCLK